MKQVHSAFSQSLKYLIASKKLSVTKSKFSQKQVNPKTLYIMISIPIKYGAGGGVPLISGGGWIRLSCLVVGFG